MKIKDDRPMMTATENWKWLIGEALTHGRNRAHCTELARAALCEWAIFMSRRANDDR